MKKLIYFLTFFLVSNSNVSAQNYPTDIQIYGLKGKVKTLSSKTYFDVDYKNEEWVVSDTGNVANLNVIYFNENGNIDSTLEVVNNKKEHYTIRTIYHYENGEKVGFTKYVDGEKESANIIWTNNRSYIETTKDPKSYYRNIVKVELDSNFREKKSEFKYYEGKKLVSHFQLLNTLDSKGLLSHYQYNDLVKNKKYTISFSSLSSDELGNTLKCTMYNKTKNVLDRYVVREIEYY